jgi:transposase
MDRKRKPYKTFTREFKIEAVRLMETSDQPSSEIAHELDVQHNQLYRRMRNAD